MEMILTITIAIGLLAFVGHMLFVFMLGIMIPSKVLEELMKEEKEVKEGN